MREQSTAPDTAPSPSSPSSPRDSAPSTAAPQASRDETAALWCAAGAAVLGLGVGLVSLRTTLPLFGRGSIGEVAAYAGMGAGLLGFVLAGLTITLRRQPWLREISRVRCAANILALGALHAVFAFLLCSALYGVFSSAFLGLALDRWTGAVWVGITAAACAYACVESALALTSESLSVLLAAFLVTGALAAALSASDPHWWHHHFSALGSGRDGFTFNLTLLLAGLALAAIGDFVGHDVALWCRATGQTRTPATIVRLALIVLGVLVIAVALIPVDAERTWHDAAAQSIVLVFAAALVGFPMLFRRLPGSFLAVTVGVIIALMVLLVLWKGVGYLGLTAFEMGAAATVMTWLVLFVRTVAAAVRSLPAAD
jgi:hypothetical protein